MALTDEQQARVEAELAETKKQLVELLAKAKTDENDAKEKEKKRASEKPDKQTAIDPDVLKEIAALKGKVENLEGKLGAPQSAGLFNFNLFD